MRQPWRSRLYRFRSVYPHSPSALRAVYAHVVNCCCFPEDKSFRNLTLETGWMPPHDRNAYEKANLLNAHKLHDLIATLDEINDENKVLDACFLYKEYIPDETVGLRTEQLHTLEWEL